MPNWLFLRSRLTRIPLTRPMTWHRKPSKLVCGSRVPNGRRPTGVVGAPGIPFTDMNDFAAQDAMSKFTIEKVRGSPVGMLVPGRTLWPFPLACVLWLTLSGIGYCAAYQENCASNTPSPPPNPRSYNLLSLTRYSSMPLLLANAQ